MYTVQSCIFLQHDSADSIQEVLVSLVDNVESATRKVVDQRKKGPLVAVNNLFPALYSLKRLQTSFLVACTNQGS